MAFRRRDVEVEAMARELIKRAASKPGVDWGQTLPPLPAISMPPSLHVCKVFDEHNSTAQMMQESCCALLADVWPDVRISTEGRGDQTCFLIFLTLRDETLGWLLERSQYPDLSAALGHESANRIIFIYDKPAGLDSPIFTKAKHTLKDDGKNLMFASLDSHEALIFRPSTMPDSQQKHPKHYEHSALISRIQKLINLGSLT